MTDLIFTLSIQGPDGFQMEYRVPIGITRFGRQPGNDIVLAHGQISRGHARLETTGSECTVTDLDSSNGTSVNGEKIPANSPVSLKDGDIVKMGPFEIAVHAVEKPVKPPESDPSVVEAFVPAEEPAKEPAEEPAGEEAEAPVEDRAEEPAPEPEGRKAPEKKPAAKKAAPAEKKKPAPKKEQAPKKEPEDSPPPAGPPPVPPPSLQASSNGGPPLPPGLSIRSTKLLDYLPGIYHTDFMARFLGIFEATLLPIEWTMDHFDMFLDPDTSPEAFLSWLGSWYGITFDSTWTDVQRRTLLKEAHAIFSRRGTAGALSRILEIYTGATPDIDDRDEKLEPFTFTVTIPLRKGDLRQDLIEALIDVHKPAHTSYKLVFKGS